MAEYWKSTPKYWCKHCQTFVKDTPLERKQHENTGKHQGNLKRFLRGIQNDHEREGRDKAKAKAEVERLNRVVGGGSTSAAPLTSIASSKSTFTKSKAGNASAEDQKRQWKQLAEMGIQVPDGVRGDMAMPGEWSVVSRKANRDGVQNDPLSVGVRKRKFEGEEEEADVGDTVVRRGWGSTTRRYPGSKPEDDDLEALLSGSSFKRDSSTKSEVKDDTAIIENTEEFKNADSEGKLRPSDDASSGASNPNLKLEPQAIDGIGSPKTIKSGLIGDKIPNNADDEGQPSTPVFKKRRAKAKTADG